MKTSIKEFKISKKVQKPLKADEKKLLPILVKAAKLVDEIFLSQEGNGEKCANFYPEGVSKETIEKAAKSNPKILSPYTIVERDNSGKLIAVEYHIKYKGQLEKISNLILKASDISKNKSFQTYLKTLAHSLLDGSYQKSDAAWIKVKNSNVDFVLGPHERYIDKLFFVKKAYQSYVNLIDQEKTKRAKKIRDIIYFNVGNKTHRVIPPKVAEICVEETLILSGFLGMALFSEQHMPTDPETEKKYGLKLIGYSSVMDYKFEKMVYPIFQAVFEKTFQKNYSKDLFRDFYWFGLQFFQP